MSPNIAVVGAGVIGLSTAINVQQAIPGARVTVIADKFFEQTTSYGSGGMFIPSITALPNVPIEDLRKWCRESWNFFRQLSLSSEASEVGTIIMGGYHLVEKDLPLEDPLYKEFVFSTEEMSRSELNDLGFQQFRTGFRVTTIIIFMRKYLNWLRKRFEGNGGKFAKRHLQNLEEVRADGESYIIPGEDLVGIGTVKQVENTNLEVDPRDTKAIIERVEKLCPNIKGAPIDHEWVGLRPGRDRVRLESEIMRFGDKRLPVVHNYGHSSQGVGLSWGTSVYAARLAADILRPKSTAKL